MQLATLIISTAALAVSVTTLAVVIIGGKRAERTLDEVQTKARTSLTAVKDAVAAIEV